MSVKEIQDMLTKTKLYLPTGKHLKIFRNSFANSAAEVCYNIASNIHNCETIGAFKHTYWKWCSYQFYVLWVFILYYNGFSHYTV